MNGFNENLIHMYNKNTASLSGAYKVCEENLRGLGIEGRRNVIVLGDSIGDLQMSHGIPDPKIVLTIGYLNCKVRNK